MMRQEFAASESKNVVLGTIFLVGAVTAFAMVDALAKLLTQDLNTIQVLWARYAFFLLPILLFTRPRRWFGLLRTERPWFQIGRGTIPVLGSLALILGLRTLSLADATAIMFAGPLIITVLSALFLKERVDAVRAIAVICGFLGVLIVARPGTGVIGTAALWPAITAFMFALFYITTRIAARTAAPMTTLFYTAVVGTVLTTAAVPFVWTPQTPAVWGIVVASGLLHGIGHYLAIKALALAEASALAPFIYFQLVAALILGVIFFGQWPDLLAATGMAVVVGAGLFAYLRQRSCAAA